MKIVVFEVEEWERTIFRALEDEHEVRYVTESLHENNAAEYSDADIISPFIYSDLQQSVLTHFSHLQLIATRSTGFDHIDTEYCKKNDITVSNVPSYGDNTVAEHVFGLLLTISHNLSEAIDRTRKGDFSQTGLQGFDLRHKILGVIGTGSIGEYVIEIAKGFQMEVIAYDIQPREELTKKLDFEYVSLDELLQKSDIITLHVPANPNTKNLISEDEFKKMKDGVVLINTSRGPLVDVRSLLQNLSSGKTAAAGLDVLPEEPIVREEAELLHATFQKKHNLETLLADHILLRMRNVFITPHSAFNTKEAVERILDTTKQNIVCFIESDPCNVVSG
jgi:D-lactate dehydrogenase